MRKNIRYSRGQVILIILLVTVVGLTIGLSLVSRTIQDVKTSSQIAESQKAFSAAEAGIEAALKGAEFGGGSLDLASGKANYNVDKWGGSSAPFSIRDVSQQDGYSVWLVAHNADGSIPDSPAKVFSNASTVGVCWGPPDSGVELTLLYKSGSMKIGKAAYNKDGSDKFTAAGTSCQGKDYGAEVSFKDVFGVTEDNDVPILLKIKPVYVNQINVVIDPKGTILPAQGKVISSTGITEAGVARKINVLQGYTSLPSIFDYTLFVE